MASHTSRRYVVDKNLQVILKDMGVSPQDVLRHARLPLDLASRKTPTVTAEEYFQFWNGLAYVLRHDMLFPLRMGRSITVEAFSPPMFACFCSPDLNTAAKRIAYYKPLVGPMRLDVTQNSDQTTIAVRGLPENGKPPATLIAMELVYWVHITRLATREHIVPATVLTTVHIPEQSAYEEYFGVSIKPSAFDAVVFTAADAARPFMTANDQMWAIFEPNLNMRMQDLQNESTFRERVRACLMEIIATGQYSMADVASRLAISTRTLQRRLKDEGTNFRAELDSLREELAINYLSKTDYSSGQIAFLLGYEDPNSFFRAFRTWTGQTPEYVRAQVQ